MSLIVPLSFVNTTTNLFAEGRVQPAETFRYVVKPKKVDLTLLAFVTLTLKI